MSIHNRILDKILAIVKDRPGISKKDLLNSFESQPVENIKSKVVSHPEYSDAVEYLWEENYISKYDRDTGGNYKMGIRYKGVLLLEKGGFEREYARFKERWQMDRFFKWGMPTATICSVVLNLILAFCLTS